MQTAPAQLRSKQEQRKEDLVHAYWPLMDRVKELEAAQEAGSAAQHAIKAREAEERAEVWVPRKLASSKKGSTDVG